MGFSLRISRPIGVAVVAVALALLALGTSGDDGRRGALASTPAAPQQQQPLFDRFDGRDFWYADRYNNTATDLFPLDRTYSTAGATLEEGENAPCAPITSSIWIAYSADRAGRVDVTVNGSGFDTTVALYEWDLAGDFIPSPPGADLLSIACMEQAAGADAAVSMTVTPGREYVIQIGSRAGGGDVRVRATCAGCAPPNDHFQNQHYLYVDPWQPEASRAVDTSFATTEPGEQRPCGQIGATVWYSMYIGTPSEVEISTAGSSFDTTLAVYRLSPANNYNWDVAALELVACDDDGAGAASLRIRQNPEEYSDYFIQAGANGDGGSLVLSARCVPYCPPYNDNAASAEYWDVPIEGYEIPTQGATVEGGEPQPCGDIGHTVWFQIVARGDTRIALSTIGSDFETAIAVYESVGFSPPPGTFDLIDCDAGGLAAIEFAANGNQTYWVQIGGVDDESGRLVLSADCVPSPCPPFHDGVAQPYYIYRSPGPEFYTEFFDVRGATTEHGEPLDCGDMGHTTWWVIDMYEGQTTWPFVFDTRESDFDTEIAVYEAPLYGNVPYDAPSEAYFDSMTRIWCAGDGIGNRARVAFDAEPGKRYYVQIGGRGGATGQLGVEISCDGPCPAENDMLASAWYVYPPYIHSVDTRATTTEAGEPLPCGNLGNTVWYFVDGSGSGEHTISTAGSDFATVIAVYTADQPSPPGGLTNVGCSASGSLTFESTAGTGYFVQVGGVDGSAGTLQLSIDCALCTFPAGHGGGGGVIYSGAIGGPDTGSGGYLPGARH